MNSQKGITLVALIITIIVLLILASVTISILTSDNGLLKNVNNSIEEAKCAKALEKLKLGINSLQINKLGQATLYDINEFADNKSDNYEKDIKLVSPIGTEDITGMVTIDGYVFIIDKKLKIQYRDPNSMEESIDNYLAGTELTSDFVLSNKDKTWHVCDATVLNINDYPDLANRRPDLNGIDYSPKFSSANARVTSSGTADGNWPAYYVFTTDISSSAGAGWLSQKSGLKWIAIDMEKNTTINKMEFTNINHQNRLDSVGAPIDFIIKGSYNNTEWEEILNVKDNTHIGMGEIYSYTFDTVDYRYYKIEITKGVPWWDGNLYHGLRSWRLIKDGEFIQLPNDTDKIIKLVDNVQTAGIPNVATVGEQVGNNIKLFENDDTWHICDGTILSSNDYTELSLRRKDLTSIDYSPKFSSANARVTSSGTADGNWPAYYIFTTDISSSAGSGWLSQKSGSKWIAIDMEKNTTINKMEFTNINHQNRLDCVGAPIDFIIKGSYNNFDWEEILNVKDNSHVGMGEVYSYTFDAVAYRYYKIEITKGVPWWDGNLYHGLRSWKLIIDGDFIQLPNNKSQIIKIK